MCKIYKVFNRFYSFLGEISLTGAIVAILFGFFYIFINFKESDITYSGYGMYTFTTILIALIYGIMSIFRYEKDYKRKTKKEKNNDNNG